MNYKKVASTIMLLLVILFLGLYVSQMTGYYQYSESRKTTLTKNAIEQFEQDIKEGKEIHAGEYLEEQTDYNNLFSKIGMNVSKLIEKGFNKAMTSIFREISNTVNNK